MDRPPFGRETGEDGAESRRPETDLESRNSRRGPGDADRAGATDSERGRLPE